MVGIFNLIFKTIGTVKNDAWRTCVYSHEESVDMDQMIGPLLIV